MEPESWPLDREYAASLVPRLVEDIDASGEQEHRALLEAFMTTAWGCRLALDQ